MAKKDRRRATYRFSTASWNSLMVYRKREIENAVEKALKQPELLLLKKIRHMRIECGTCRSSGHLGGAALTTYTCKKCNRREVNSNTAVPNLCEHCAFKGFLCQYCMVSLDIDLSKTESETEG